VSHTHEHGQALATDDGRRSAVLHVGNLHYASEKAVVERVLGKRPGVVAVEANPVAQTATVCPDGPGRPQLHSRALADFAEPLAERSLLQAFRDGASRARTGDLLGAIQALSQLSYSPVRLTV
jgi:hypothetical protein